jgi:hypothetical protein
MEGKVTHSTGNVVVKQGWETGLVKGNPNLGHWHWDAMYSFPSSRPKGPQKPEAKYEHLQANNVAQVSHYLKPKHVALPVVCHVSRQRSDRSTRTNTSLSWSSSKDKGGGGSEGEGASYSSTYTDSSKGADENSVVHASQLNVHAKLLLKGI